MVIKWESEGKAPSSMPEYNGDLASFTIMLISAIIRDQEAVEWFNYYVKQDWRHDGKKKIQYFIPYFI